MFASAATAFHARSTLRSRLDVSCSSSLVSKAEVEFRAIALPVPVAPDLGNRRHGAVVRTGSGTAQKPRTRIVCCSGLINRNRVDGRRQQSARRLIVVPAINWKLRHPGPRPDFRTASPRRAQSKLRLQSGGWASGCSLAPITTDLAVDVRSAITVLIVCVSVRQALRLAPADNRCRTYRTSFDDRSRCENSNGFTNEVIVCASIRPLHVNG